VQDIKKIESQLRERLTLLSQRVDKIDDDLSEPADDDFEEMATEAANDEVLEGVSQLAEDEIRQIKLALKRIEDGVYGECIKCGEPISPARLEAVPFTTRCINCAT